jgi:hypothetical protein
MTVWYYLTMFSFYYRHVITNMTPIHMRQVCELVSLFYSVSKCFYKMSDSKTAVMYYDIYTKGTTSITYLLFYLEWQRKVVAWVGMKIKIIQNYVIFYIFSYYQYNNSTV